MSLIARAGSGFVDYLYPDPARNFTVQKKTSYVIDVDGTWFLGSVIYSSGMRNLFLDRMDKKRERENM